MVQTKKNLNPFAKIVSEIASLKRLYPEGKLVYNNKLSFTWEMDVKPTPLSIVYRIKIVYRYGDIPKVYIVSPFPLDRYPEKSLLPHVYSTKEQRICLYYPGIGEWKKSKLLAFTIVPWASEWLQFYEIWLSIGEWLGEGIHPIKKDEIND